MSPHSPCDAQKDSTPSSGTTVMFLNPTISTNSAYFPNGPLRIRASAVVTHQPAEYTVCVSAHKGDGPCVQQTGCGEQRGSCYIGVEPHSQTTVPVLFVKGWVASESSLAGKRHPETAPNWLVKSISKPLFVLFILFCYLFTYIYLLMYYLCICYISIVIF